MAVAVSFDTPCEGAQALQRPQRIASKLAELVHPGFMAQYRGAFDGEVLGGEAFGASAASVCAFRTSLEVVIDAVSYDDGARERIVSRGTASINPAEFLWGVARGSVTIAEGAQRTRYTFTADVAARRDDVRLYAVVANVKEA